MVEWNVLTHCQSSVITITWRIGGLWKPSVNVKLKANFPAAFLSMKIFLHQFCLVLVICLVFKKGTCRNTETKTVG